ncbi:MAG: phosphoribosylanthranilate isomerase [Dehalococcoidales bacterium]|nr:phosphoribosylanthranilate isomerase [Dehalococcoidales bacterium]MDZ4230346.1 phosphoribosylanthranilate isomerase [Dehalococcoidales bacterium]
MPSHQYTRIKICGITSVADARLAAEAGADYIGVIIEIDFSPRRLSVEQARPICEQSTLPVVTLFFNREAEQIRKAVDILRPHAIQLLGQEPPSLISALKNTVNCQLWKSIHLPPLASGAIDIAVYEETIKAMVDAGIDAIIIDTFVGSAPDARRYGGTGVVSDWEVARRLVETSPVPTFLAGGINPQNVRQAIEQVHPYGIDLCSGVESAPGQKDPEKLRQLISAIHGIVPVKR